MKMLLLVIFVALAAPASIHAATLPLYQCEMNKLVLAHIGMCAMDVQVGCFDFCTGESIDTAESCSSASECCWTGDQCIFKTTLKRSKRQARSGVEGSINHDQDGTTLSGRVNQAIGKNGNAFLSGTYHHPSNDWQVGAGYEHTLPNDGKFSISGTRDSYDRNALSGSFSGRALGGRLGASVNTDSYGGHGVRAEYSRKFLGGNLGINAGVQSDPWRGSNPTFGFSFSKRWRK